MMRIWCSLILACGVIASAGGSATGQNYLPSGSRFSRPFFLVQNTGVQKELKLSDEQVKKITSIPQQVQEKLRAKFEELDKDEIKDEKKKELMDAALKDATEQMNAILTPGQRKRLKQISLQHSGGVAFTDPDVVKALKLTPDQQARMKKLLQDANDAEMREILSNAGGNYQEISKKTAELRKETMAKAIAVLTDGQKKVWKDLTGEPFDVKIERRRPTGREKKPAESKPPAAGVRGRPASTTLVAWARPGGAIREDLSWVEKRVQEWQPTKQERRIDEIGWAKDLREAMRLGKEHNRPVFLFALAGSMVYGRC